ncbi:hypothetical protein ACJRO7_012535 [Eucalyptus globulus]|uniref:Transmembrane protein n=1 Tax=Eucalyptus globulus TaxID=34317 RepID=A0ABD3LM88_EUCGL
MESIIVAVLKQKLKFASTLKEAAKIPFKSANLLVVILIASVPLLCFLLYYETLLQETLSEIFRVLEKSCTSLEKDWPFPLCLTRRVSKDLTYRLIRLGFLYLIPLHPLELLALIPSITASSKVYTEEIPSTLAELMRTIHNHKARTRGTIITSLLVLFLSISTLVGSFWLVTVCYVVIRGLRGSFMLWTVYRAACIGMLVMYIEATAIWNMSFVISVLEDCHGPKAIALATNMIKRDEQCLVPLMLVLFVCGSWCRLICLKSTCSHRFGVEFLCVCLLHLGNVIKLMACVVCFHNRKGRTPKEVDEKA